MQLADSANADLSPIALSIKDACAYSGLSRSELYRRFRTGDIEARKLNSRTLVLMDSLRQFIATLPRL